MLLLYIIIYVIIPIAFIMSAYLAVKYHSEFNKLKESVDLSKDMISKIIEKGQSDVKEDISNQNKKLTIINEIAKEVNQSLELHEILQDTLDRIVEILEIDAGIIMIKSKKKQILKPVAFSGIPVEIEEEIKNKYIKSDSGSRGKAISTGIPVKAKKHHESSTITGLFLADGNLKSILMVPLKAKNEVVGLMEVGSKKEDKFSPEERDILDTVGNQIGIAINNANLYETIKNQLEQLEKKNSRLTELEQTKTNLVELIVHDLKNPLMGIMGYTDLLLEDEETYDSDKLKSLKMIALSSKDLMRMILNLLDISRMDEQRVTLKLDEVNIKDLITKNISDVCPLLLKENKTIKLDMPEKLPIIKVDKDLIYRVIANLLNNAIKYSPFGGTITIGANFGQSGRWVTLYITDEGEGIPKDYQDKIFEKFIQIEARSEKILNLRTSRGLGLTFCKMAIESHGGRIWVESDIGKGSKFCFNLPFIYFPDEEEYEKISVY